MQYDVGIIAFYHVLYEPLASEKVRNRLFAKLEQNEIFWSGFQLTLQRKFM